MFTGLIEDLGSVRELRRSAGAAQLTVATALPMAELSLGESIAVNGICLTVTAFGSGAFTADVSPETLQRTNLGELAAGTAVNLERALRLSDRLGGHLVSGHVDGVATVEERRQDGNAIRFRFCCAAELTRLMVEKGSVAVDGISLTLNGVASRSFEVAVIPHSLARTTLHQRRPGSRVNLETDLLGKYVQRLLTSGSAGADRSNLSLEFLAKHGFV